jgi:hypothetical protein
MNRSITGFVAVIALGSAVLAGLAEAKADYRRGGLLGGMSAAEVMGGAYSPGYGYWYGSGDPAPVDYRNPGGPPPGCIIRRQRMWDGYGWRWHKLRICH